MIELSPSPSLVDNPNCSDWLDFSIDGKVLLRTGKVEIGQGILTALVQIAADELDVSPDCIDVLSGHTRLGPLEGQTSSSLSLEVSGRAIRLAASATRKRLAEEAAALLQAQPDEVSFVDGVAHVSSRETPLTVWSLARTVDLDVPVMEHAGPKQVAARRIIGTSMPRLDLPAKTVGAPFIHDIVLDGMMHGRILQPPSQTSRIVRFDSSAFAIPFPDVTLVRSGSFIGVVAEREDVAIKAIEHAGSLAEWDEGASVPDDLVAAVGEADVPEEIIVESGEAPAASDQSISLAIRKPFLAHASIAPSCAIATWRDGHLEVYSHTQGPHGLRDALGIVFGIDALSDVTVIHKPGAGTYGHSGQDDVACDAALLARELPGTPVRVAWSRADDFIASPLGPGMVVKAGATLDGAGRLSSFSVTSHSQPHAQRPGRGGVAGLTSAELIDPPFPWVPNNDVPMARGGGADRNGTPLYKAPNLRVAKRIWKDLPVRTSALRGLGAFANIIAVEAIMDEAANTCGADPVQFRLDHLEDDRAKAVIEKAAEMAGWPGKTTDTEALGIGFGQYKNKSTYCAVVAHVHLDEQVNVTRVWACADAGEVINPDGLVNQIEGGIIQGTSWTLKEAIQFDGDRVITDSWQSYPILKFTEVPLVEVALIDRPELQPLGAGETSLGPTAAAIANAVSRALGIRVTELPITRDSIERLS